MTPLRLVRAALLLLMAILPHELCAHEATLGVLEFREVRPGAFVGRWTMDPGIGAARVDLTGKTVIPALIDAHSHIGYMHDLTSGPQNYTRENILDHMNRFAYHGVAASMA